MIRKHGITGALPYSNFGSDAADVVTALSLPTTGMFLWYKSDETYTAADGSGSKIATNDSSIYSLKDMSGNSRHCNQSNGSYQPKYFTNQVAGYPSFRFDGGDDYMKTAAYTLTQPFTYYMVVKQITWTRTDYFFDALSNDYVCCDQQTASPILEFYAGGSPGYTSDLAVDSWGLLMIVFDGANSIIKVNDGTDVTGNIGTNNGNGLTLANRNGLGYAANIEFAEIAFYSGAHVAASGDGLQARTYFKNKYLLW